MRISSKSQALPAFCVAERYQNLGTENGILLAHARLHAGCGAIFHVMAVGKRWISQRRASEGSSRGRVCSYDMICDLACLLVVGAVAAFAIKYFIWGWVNSPPCSHSLKWRHSAQYTTNRLETVYCVVTKKFSNYSASSKFVASRSQLTLKNCHFV